MFHEAMLRVSSILEDGICAAAMRFCSSRSPRAILGEMLPWYMGIVGSFPGSALEFLHVLLGSRLSVVAHALLRGAVARERGEDGVERRPVLAYGSSVSLGRVTVALHDAPDVVPRGCEAPRLFGGSRCQRFLPRRDVGLEIRARLLDTRELRRGV